MNSNEHPSLLASLRSFSRPARLVLLATIFDGIVYSAWQLFFNFFILARGFDKEFLGLANAAPMAAALVFGIPMGMISDRIGRKKAMLIGLILYSLGMAAQVTARQPGAVLLAAFAGGLGYALWNITLAPFMMSASDDQNRAMLFSLNYGLITLSGAAGSLFAGQLPARFATWLNISADSATAYQAVLLCSVLVSLTSLIPISLIRENTRVAAQKQPRRSIFLVLRDSTILKLMLPNLFIGSGAGIVIPYLNLFFAERFGMSDQTLGLLFGLSSLLTGIGNIFGPRLALWANSKIRVVVFTQFLSLSFLMVMGFVPLEWAASLGFLMRGTFMNMAYPLYNAFSMERIRPEDQGAANGLFNMVWTLGWVVGPSISGVVQARYGFSPLFLAMGVLYLTGILLTWFFFRQSENPPRLATAD